MSVTLGSDTVGKALQLLTEAVPKVRRVAFLSNPANVYSASAISNVRAEGVFFEGQERAAELRPLPPPTVRPAHRVRI